MTAHTIERLLARRHAFDIFVPQCKTGASYGRGLLILDAWVMPRSWVKPILAYEIKVSRGDFRRDTKWREYLPYCHRFYFVTPCELVKPEEVPAEAGLLWTTKKGDDLRQVRRAPARDVEIPVAIYQYVLMWRVTGSPWERRAGTDKEIGHLVETDIAPPPMPLFEEASCQS